MLGIFFLYIIQLPAHTQHDNSGRFYIDIAGVLQALNKFKKDVDWFIISNKLK
ncbi:hypothetical protein LT679_06150 [Mucilaginibacter roseus]|uniref:Uncharacterized protein n=1 Tax=Mucilaginibacter roseus TaxID=1528868 RepID=A0ABS8TZ76_9SPHI|nr:hypothetical protein [Mucilaginibacter roseus]MCD8740179.1 hypothetical protein [Mucilaginibacter roseus]